MTRRYAYSLGGSRAVDFAPLSKPKNTTILSSIQLDGTLHYTTFSGGTTVEKFKRYLETDLLPHLNGDAILIMDNMKSHHAKAVKNLLDSSGIRYIYLPPYSVWCGQGAGEDAAAFWNETFSDRRADGNACGTGDGLLPGTGIAGNRKLPSGAAGPSGRTQMSSLWKDHRAEWKRCAEKILFGWVLASYNRNIICRSIKSLGLLL